MAPHTELYPKFDSSIYGDCGGDRPLPPSSTIKPYFRPIETTQSIVDSIDRLANIAIKFMKNRLNTQ